MLLLSLAKQCLLLQKLMNVVVEPQTIKQMRWHILGASDGLFASGLAAETIERLGHAPFGRRIEELMHERSPVQVSLRVCFELLSEGWVN